MLLPLAALKRRVLEPLRLVSEEGDVRPLNPGLNRAFLSALLLENALLRRLRRLPIGLSAIILASKPPAARA